MKDIAHAIGRIASGLAAAAAVSLALAGEARAQFTGPGTYRIDVVISGKSLDLDASWWRDRVEGMPLIQWGWHGGENQRFVFNAAPGGTFTISPRHSGFCLQVQGASSADGAEIQQARCNGSLNQRFFVGAYLWDTRYCHIVSAMSRKKLSVGSLRGGDDHDNGARIIQTGRENQWDTLFVPRRL